MLMTLTDSSGGKEWERLLTCTSTGSTALTLQLGQPRAEFTFLISLWLSHARGAVKQKKCHLQLPEEPFEETLKHTS